MTISRRNLLASAAAVAVGSVLTGPGIANAASIYWMNQPYPDGFWVEAKNAPGGSYLQVWWYVNGVKKTYRTSSIGSPGAVNYFAYEPGWTSGGATLRTRYGRRLAVAPTLYPPNVTPTETVGVGWTMETFKDYNIFTPAAIDPDFTRILDTGSSWVRMSVPMWLAGGVWNGAWSTYTTQLDAMAANFRAAKSRGLKTCCVILAPQGDQANPDQQHFLDLNRAGLTVIGNALKGLVDVWQVLNEWNTGPYWDGVSGPSNTVDVANFLAMAAPVLHGTNPGTVVTTTLGGYPSDQARWNSWANLYRTVGGPLDALGVNAYPDPNMPSTFASQATYLNGLRTSVGKPVYVFETGTCTPTSQMATLATTAIPGMVNGLSSGGPVVLFGYQIRDRATGSADGEDCFGVYTTAGAKKAHWQPTVDAIAQSKKKPVGKVS